MVIWWLFNWFLELPRHLCVFTWSLLAEFWSMFLLLTSISFPDGTKIAEMQEIVWEKYPAKDRTCFVMDGLKWDIEKSSCVLEQNAFYNGWQHSHWVVNILVFDLTCKVMACGLNAPGSWHDSHMISLGRCMMNMVLKQLWIMPFQCQVQTQTS